MASPTDKPPLDWRYRTATVLTEKWESPYTGNTYLPGTPVSKSTFVRHGDQELKLGDPSAPALFLNLAHRSYVHAMEKHPLQNDTKLPKNVDPSRIAYDYLEAIMSSIIFAFSSIEAWANEEIPDNYQYEYQRGSGIFVSQSKEAIERRVDLSEKLATILPEIMNVPSPKGTKIWQQFVELKRMRDRVIHLKSSDRATSKDRDLYPDSIWSKLLDPSQPNYPSYAKHVITHYISQERYHWLKYCPVA